MKLFGSIVFVIYVALGLTACGAPQVENIAVKTFAMLDGVREDKTKTISTYLDKLQEKVTIAKHDQDLVDLFYQTRKSQDVQSSSRQNFTKQAFALDKHYVQDYGEFYDILFVDKGGLVFHTVKMESDFHKNIFEGALRQTKLAIALKQNPDIGFVNYEY